MFLKVILFLRSRVEDLGVGHHTPFAEGIKAALKEFV